MESDNIETLFDPKTFGLDNLDKNIVENLEDNVEQNTKMVLEDRLTIVIDLTTSTTTESSAQNGQDNFDELDRMPPDVYLTLVIVSVSLIVLVLLSYALYKAVSMLKVSLNDGREDSMPVPGGGQNGGVPTVSEEVHPVPILPNHAQVQAARAQMTAGPSRQGSQVTYAQLSFFQGKQRFLTCAATELRYAGSYNAKKTSCCCCCSSSSSSSGQEDWGRHISVLLIST